MRCKMDKKTWFEKQLENAEAVASVGDSNTLYRCVKELYGHVQQTVPIKHNAVFIFKTHVEQAARWKEHFGLVFDCPDF